MKDWTWTLVLAGTLAGGAIGGEPDFRPLAVDWNSPPDSPASLAFLLDAPAGKDGFVRASDGHLLLPSGSRLRIWGVNITGKAALPSKDAAPLLAAHLARCGINCVRLHFL